MITNITMSGEPSYPDEGANIEPTKINYLYGANGTGKTTISRVIAEANSPERHKLQWQNNQPLDVFVYNSDFIEEHFASQMDGVFTLGADEKSTVEELQTKNAERSRIQNELTCLNNTLSTKQEEWGKKLDQFKEVCWEQKVKFESDFRPALQGSMNSKASFCERVLNENSTNSTTLLSLETLQNKAQTLFAEDASKVGLIAIPDISELCTILSNPIWQKVVIGSSDIGIAALINRLKNSDWVGQGRKYLDDSEESCPFCQQGLPHDFRNQLEQYFRGEFVEDVKLIGNLIEQHGEQCSQLLAPLESLSEDQKSFLEGGFEQSVGTLRRKFKDNHRLLKQKAEGPSQQIKPDDIQDLCDKVLAALSNTNLAISEHNTRIDNLNSEQRTLIAEVWRSILDALQEPLAAHNREETNFNSAATNLNTQIEANRSALNELDTRIAALERGTVSVRPTVEAINKTLNDYGFGGFRLEIDGDKEDKYRLLRNGVVDNEIHRTLSEGEKSFITFLYFYHLISGSLTSSGTLTDRVVVFDDPVSSLDSNVLFIISTPVRKVIEDVKRDDSRFKQAFVLTHNVFFHRQVTFRADGKRGFWVVRKTEGQTSIDKHDTNNPVRTAYELLWEELRAETPSRTALPNALRRILEYYFKILGGCDFDKLLEDFEGENKLVVGSLISWAHSGSHADIEEIDYVTADLDVQRGLFKHIFEKTGNIAHYEMMMGAEASDASQGQTKI